MRDAVATVSDGLDTMDGMPGADAGVHPKCEAGPLPSALLRLSRETLRQMPPAVRRPRFDPALLRPGILHLGCGSFHRAHQAMLTQEAIEAESNSRTPPAWGIVGASLQTPTIVEALDRQDGLYTVLERGPNGTSATVVASLCRRIFGPRQRELLRRTIADPTIRIVTLTVTPTGYFRDPITGRLDGSDPLIVADLQMGHRRTAIGVLVQAFSDRRAAGVPAPVILSCDNLASNGRVLRQMCLDFAALHDDGLASWIAQSVQFASTMVDRIVPTPTQDDRTCAEAITGLSDGAALSAEPFRQWVIEAFDGPRPRWEAAGAQFVSNVRPWEESKLRLLNGGHLALTFFGLLAGCTTVAETMALPGCASVIRRLMCEEQKPTLPPSDHDIDAYADQLIERWKNPAIAHCLLRVGRDASGKLPTRLLAPLQENRLAGRPTPLSVLALAAWMRCAVGVDDSCRPLALSDPMGERLRVLSIEAGPGVGSLVDHLLAVEEIFGPEVRADQNLRQELCVAVKTLCERGARAVLASLA
jgi:fructuronate reductase